MARLRTALKRARWKTLRHDYRADMPVADGVSYSIRYHGKTVFTEDGADPPKRFERVKAILTRIAEQHR